MVEPLRILILEDVPADAALVERELLNGGLQFVSRCVESEPEFLAALDEFKPHVILSDYTLPSFDGMAALHLARERVPTVPFIIVTGTLSEEIAVECIKAGADDYVLKDRLTRLPAAVRAAIERRRLEEDKRRAEEALNASEEKYRRILENMDESYFEVDLAGNLTFFNDSLCRLLGYPRDELMGMNNRQFTDKEYTKKVFQAFNQIHTTGESTREFDWEVVRKDGTRRHIETSASLRRDSSGQPIGFSGLFRDITERRRTQAALRESEERFRQLAETMPDAVMVGQDGRNVYANSAAARLLHAAGPEELVGRDVAAIVDPAKHGWAWQKMQRALAAETQPPFEDSFVRLDGSLVPVEVAVSLLTWQGRPAVQVVVRDITERKRVEEALRQSEARFKGAFASSPNGMALVAPDGRWLEVNPALCQIVGYSEEELLGKTFQDITHPDDLDSDLIYVRQMLTGEIPTYQMKKRYLHKQGQVVWILLSVSLVRDSAGQPLYFVSQIEDITERKRAEEALQQSEERFRSIFDNFNDGILAADATTRKFLFGNRAISQMLGYTPEELMALGVSEIHPQKDLSAVMEAFDKLVRRESKMAPGLPVKRKDGSVFYADINSFPLQLQGGSRLIGIFRDITERKQAEEDLRNSKQIIEGILNAIPVSVFWKDKNLVYLGCNAIFARDAGFADPRDLIGKDDYQMGWRDRAELYRGDDREVIKSGCSKLLIEEPLTTPGGNTITILTSKLPLRDSNGEITGLLGTYMDITERKRADEALRATEARYRLIAENTADVIWTLDLATRRFTYMSPSIEKLCGFSAEEVLAQPFEASLTPDSLRRVEEELAAVTAAIAAGHQSAKTSTMEVETPTRDGGVVPTEIVATALTDASGRVIGVLGVTRDITDRKRAEESLRESEERFRSLYQNSTMGLYRTTPDGRILVANPALVDMLGYASFDELASRNLTDDGFQPSYLRAQFLEAIERDGEVRGMEATLTRADGSAIFISQSARAIHDSSGKTLYYDGSIENITERKRVEQALRESEERYRLIAENMADVIWTLDLATRRLTYVSPSVARLRGFTPEEVMGQPFSASLTPGSRRRVDAYLAAALAAFAAGDQSARTGTVEADMPTKDGGIVQTEIVATALMDASGRVTGVLGVTRDITQRKRTEEALHESEERFRTLYENSPIGLYRTTPDGRVLMANRTFVDMLGYASFDELAARNLADDGFQPSYPRAHFLEAIEKDGEVKGMEATWKQADGSMVFIRESARAVHDAEGNTLYYDGSVENITERRRAEEALRASEELYRLIMASVSDGIFAVDMTGRFTFASPRALEITGYRQDEVVGYHFNEVLGSEAQIRASEMFELALAGKEIPLYDIGITTKGGRILPIELNMSTLRGADGSLVGRVGVFRDITERTKAQAALAASEKKYRTLFDAADDAILIFEPEGETILEANPRACQLYGFSREELIGTSLKKLTVDVSRGERRLADLIHDGVLRNFESVYLRRDGSHVPVLINAKVIEFEGREAALALIRDMTEQRRAEQELRLRGSALEAAANAILIADTEGTIQWANPAFTWLTGYSLDEVRGKNPRILKSGVQDRATYQELWRTITLGSVWHGEMINRRKDGTLYSEEMTITPVRDASGTIAHFIAVKQDITERQQAEAEREKLEEILRQSQKMDAVGQLAGGVAHDFNNLLQAMLNLSQFLVTHCTDPERVAADAAELEQQVKHGAALTRQLLLFSRRETARPETLDLNEVVREAGKLLRRLLKANITIEQRPAERKLPVVADRGQIEQVLFNLAVNAADAMPQGGRLVITTGSDASTVWLQVADTGVGIPEGIRQRIFEPFFTTKGEGKGTGLGLAVVHGIVAQHGGSIACESHKGQGTTFTITLPRGDSGEFAALKVKGQEDEATAGRGERVLIVEDEAAARDSLAEILTVLGYEVVAVGSGEEAGLLPPEPAFKVLLTDIMLPGIAGADLARGLLERWPELKVILMSGYTEDEAMRKGISASPVRFLQKPFGMSALARELRSALDEAPAAGD